MKIKKTIQNIVYIALLSALLFVVTYFIRIPYMGNAGYFNISDGLILFFTIYFGPIIGIPTAIIGTTLADLASGFANFMIPTAIAKGLESIICFIIFYFLRKTKYLKFISLPISSLIMVLVYFASYIILFGTTYAYTSSLFDLIQAAFGVIISLVLYSAFKYLPIKHYQFN